jgi:nucleotide-binding universal stress UspA family protein
MARDRPRVVLGVADSPAGWAAMRAAVSAARHRNAVVYAVRVLPPASGGGPPLVAGLRAALIEAADALVRDVVERALGGPPADVDIEVVTVDGPVGHALVNLADRDTDLLVLGARRRRRCLGHQPGRYCLARAVCPVLVVPVPELARTTTRRQARELGQEVERVLSAGR